MKKITIIFGLLICISLLVLKGVTTHEDSALETSHFAKINEPLAKSYPIKETPAASYPLTLNQANSSLKQQVEEKQLPLETQIGNDRVLSADDNEQVLLDIDNQQLVVTDISTSEVIYRIPLSEDLLEQNLDNAENNINIVTELDSFVEYTDKDQIEGGEHFGSSEPDIDILYDQEFSNGVILRRDGFEEFVSTDQLENVLELVEPTIESN